MRQLIENRIKILLEEADAGTICMRPEDEQFLQDCVDKYGGPDTELSEKQEAWVNDLHEKYCVKSCPWCG